MLLAPARLWTTATSSASDRATIEGLGTPSAVLMERAALCVARAVVEARAGGDLAVMCLCGPGNNGGDALAVARILKGWEVEAAIVLATERRNAAADRQLTLARSHGVPVTDMPAGPVVWVDGLLGTGGRGAPRGGVKTMLESVRDARGPRVAIDVPSGVDPDSGGSAACAFRAHHTVTFGRSKPGLHVTPGRAFAGRVTVADIGLVPPDGAGPDLALIDPRRARARVDALPAGAHKGQRGHVGVVGGSFGTTGAAVLVGTAALRAGAGLVTLASGDPRVRQDVVQHRPELMITDLDPVSWVARATALVVGPGLTNPADRDGLEAAWRDDGRPAIWDASGLETVPVDTPPPGPRVLTPHPGEAAALLQRAQPTDTWTAARVQANRLVAGSALAKAFKAVVVLKGEGSVVAHPDGRLRIGVTGGPALATAGSGDVLAGLVGALLGRGMSAWDAAQVAVHVHGLAGELAGRRFPGTVAGEVAACLPQALRATGPVAGWPELVRG